MWVGWMGRIHGSRIIPDPKGLALVNGWAVIILGRVRPDWIFVTKAAAERAALLKDMKNCPIVPVAVYGAYVERLDSVK